MNSKIIQAALKILLIKEEYTENEIIEAIKLIGGDGQNSSLIDFFNKEGNRQPQKKELKKGEKKISDQTSKVIVALENSDPKKFSVLSEFELLIKKGILLTKVSDIRTLALKISKDFPEIKSRRDAIPKFIELLANTPLEILKNIIEEAAILSKLPHDSSEYQELAHFLITGTKQNYNTKQ